MKKILIILLVLFTYSCRTKKVANTPSIQKTYTVDADADGVIDFIEEDLDSPPNHIFVDNNVVVGNSIGSVRTISRDVDNFVDVDNLVNVESEDILRDTLVNVIELGRFVYEIPTKMVKFETYTIKARINRDIKSKNILQGLDRTFDTIIRTSEVMLVELIDPTTTSFKIVSQSKKQFIDITGPTEWVFFVTPLTYGEKPLSIVVSVIKDDNLKQTVYEDNVIISTTIWLEFKIWMMEHWKWLFVVLIIPFLKWLYGKTKNKNRLDSVIN